MSRWPACPAACPLPQIPFPSPWQAERHKQALAVAEMHGTTFHPEISAKAHELWDGEGGPKVR